MSKQYFVRADKNKDFGQGNWLEISGKEFYKLVSSPEGKNRHFIKFKDYVIESSKEKYKKWQKEKDHADYLVEQSVDYKLFSLYSDFINEYGSGEDIIKDNSELLEDIVFLSIRRKALRKAINELNIGEKILLERIFNDETKESERKIAEKMNLSQNAVNKQKKKIIKKLKFLVVKFEKSSQ